MPEIAQTDAQIEACFDVMSELRPQVCRSEFPALVREMQSEGYRMAYIEHQGQVVAVAGYRIGTSFFLGRHLFVDDLVTSSARRGQGFGEALLEWLGQEAENAGCVFLDLESGTQRARAHKFYFRHGFVIDSYHFSRRLRDR